MPKVSIIVPCYNEQETVQLLLSALHDQTYPLNQMEVVVADGMSTDQTRARIVAYQRKHPQLAIQIVDNFARHIPAGVNRAIEAATGDFIIRMDAHAIPEPDYVQKCVQALESNLGDNIGGVWQIRPGAAGWMARSIAVAAAHPLGVGGAQYRVGGQSQAVDTVPFGAFRSSIFDRIGLFDESLLSNEDYEFNTRIRKAGGKVWFDPEIRCAYFARSNFSALARQYWRYGFWKMQMLRRYPESIRWRQGLPPLFIISLLVMGLVGFFIPQAFWLAMVELAAYLLVLFIVGVQQALKQRDFGLVLGFPLAVVTMHFSWGLAFLWSLMTILFNWRKNKPRVTDRLP